MSTSPPPAPGTDLAQRYGTERPGRRRVVVVVASVLAVVALGWLAWAAIFHSTPAVRSELVTFTIDDQHGATVRTTVVRRDPDVEASCLLRAFAADHQVVGELDFTVGPGGAELTTVDQRVRTERQATAVDLIGCVADGQSQRR